MSHCGSLVHGSGNHVPMRIAGFALCLVACAPDEPIDMRTDRPDGARRLTFPHGYESNQNACVSPDGTFVVYTRFSEGYNDGPAHLFRLDLDREGAEPQRLTDGDQDDVTVPWGCFDRASGRVVFASDREDANDLWTVMPDPDAPDLRRITTHGAAPLWIEPVFDPTGRFVAVEQDDDIDSEEGQRAQVVTVELATGAATVLTNMDRRSDDRLPSWSPDGATILYQHRDPTEPESLDRWHALLVPTDGGAAIDVSSAALRGDAGPDTDLSWMPDGAHVLSSANHFGSDQPSIWALPVTGGKAIRVTDEAAHEDGAPCATPDGRRIVFESHRTSDEESQSDLWVIDAPREIQPG